MLQVTNPDGTFNRTVYEPLVTKSFDENDTDPTSPDYDTPSVHYQDGLGRLIRTDEITRLNDDGTPSGQLNTWTSAYQHDPNDRLTRITDSQGNVKTMIYDGLKRKTFMNDPDCGTVAYTYDDASNLKETLNAKGQQITYTYDGANRILAADYLDDNSFEFSYHRSPDVAYFYDEPADSVDSGDGSRSTARNTKGMLAYVQDTSGEEHTSYDARGRVEWTIKRIPDPLLQDSNAPPLQLVSYRTTFEYDSLDRVTTLIYPDNDQVSYEYNDRGLLQRIVGGPSGSILSNLVYAPSAQQQQVDYGNGVRTTHSYDNRQRLVSLLTFHVSRFTDQFINFNYTFDGVSNIKAIADQRDTSVVSASDTRRNSQTFAYDDLYRLTRVQYDLPAASTNNGGQIDYRYDRIGNMLSQTSDIQQFENGFSVTQLGAMSYGGTAGASGRVGRAPTEAPGPHALTGVSQPSTNNSQPRLYGYDANGNMTNIDGLACTWDFKDRLVAVEDDTMRTQYSYDYTDRRITKRVRWKPGYPRPSDGRGAGGECITTTVYVNNSFEVRDHDQPTKYVFNGVTRVAAITGSLSPNSRIQRLRLWPGWNLICLAVTAANALDQLNSRSASGGQGEVLSIYQWNPPTGDYSPVTAGQTVSAGAVLWVKAPTNAVVGIVGTYSDPANQHVEAGGTYVPGTGLEAWSPTLPPTFSAWMYDPESSHWHDQFTGDLASLSDPPPTLAPGEALFVKTTAPADLEIPDPTLRIRYYHQDHLGSSSVLSDAAGTLVEEIAFYPFGIPRDEYQPRQLEEPYQFTQKERDQESGLHYFEARYLAGRLSRFATPDLKYANPDSLSGDSLAGFLSDPQEINLYAYVRNHPLRYVDSTGLDKSDRQDFKKEFDEAAKWSHDNPDDRLVVDWDAVKMAPVHLFEDTVELVFGGSSANAPGPGAKTYPSQSYGTQAKNIALFMAGGKLLGGAGKLVGGLLDTEAATAGGELLGAGEGAVGAEGAGAGGDAAAKTWPGGWGRPVVPFNPAAYAAKRAEQRTAQLAERWRKAINSSPKTAWTHAAIDASRPARIDLRMKEGSEALRLIYDMADFLFDPKGK